MSNFKSQVSFDPLKRLVKSNRHTRWQWNISLELITRLKCFRALFCRVLPCIWKRCYIDRSSPSKNNNARKVRILKLTSGLEQLSANFSITVITLEISSTVEIQAMSPDCTIWGEILETYKGKVLFNWWYKI